MADELETRTRRDENGIVAAKQPSFSLYIYICCVLARVCEYIYIYICTYTRDDALGRDIVPRELEQRKRERRGREENNNGCERYPPPFKEKKPLSEDNIPPFPFGAGARRAKKERRKRRKNRRNHTYIYIGIDN